jgi:hypothetical protein
MHLIIFFIIQTIYIIFNIELANCSLEVIEGASSHRQGPKVTPGGQTDVLKPVLRLLHGGRPRQRQALRLPLHVQRHRTLWLSHRPGRHQQTMVSHRVARMG